MDLRTLPSEGVAIMSEAFDQARFAAREFIARLARETGEALSAPVTDLLLFAYEMGQLRGQSAAALDAMKMFNEISRTREEARKRSNDDTK